MKTLMWVGSVLCLIVAGCTATQGKRGRSTSGGGTGAAASGSDNATGDDGGVGSDRGTGSDQPVDTGDGFEDTGAQSTDDGSAVDTGSGAGGDTVTSSGGGEGTDTGPVGVPGKCTESDEPQIASGVVAATAWDCANSCLEDGGGCTASCVAEGTGIALECAGCFAGVANCAAEECFGPCGEAPGEAQCQLCQGQAGCLDGFEECTEGDPDAPGDTSGTGGSDTTGSDTTGTGGSDTTGTGGSDTTGTGGDTTDTGGGVTDTGGGSTTSGGTGSDYVQGEPCPVGMTYEGCCQNNHLVWCEADGKVGVVDCNANPSCGWKPGATFYDCGTEGAAEPTGTHPIDCP